jgi:hypothetical protein
MKNLRLLALIFAATATLSACSSGTGSGDTNVEVGSTKKGPAAEKDGNPAGDSLTAGMRRDSGQTVTGKKQFENADRSVDRNHDGLAD